MEQWAKLTCSLFSRKTKNENISTHSSSTSEDRICFTDFLGHFPQKTKLDFIFRGPTVDVDLVVDLFAISKLIISLPPKITLRP